MQSLLFFLEYIKIKIPIKKLIYLLFKCFLQIQFRYFIQQCGLRDFTSQTIIHPKGLIVYRFIVQIRSSGMQQLTFLKYKTDKILRRYMQYALLKQLATELEHSIILLVISMGLQMFPNST